MASGKISASWDYDRYGEAVLLLSKKRGKLNLDEVGDFLRYSPGGRYQGNWIMFIQAGVQTCEGSGWPFVEEPKEDIWELYQVEQGEKCPVCNRELPDFQWCPNCGEPINEEGPTQKQALENVEKIIGTMKKETLDKMKDSDNKDMKKSWYYAHLGAVHFACQMGLITEERKKQLCREFDRETE